MLQVEQVLNRLKIRTASRNWAVQDVRELIETSADPIGTAKTIMVNFGVDDYKGNDAIEARMTAQRLVDEALILGDKYDPKQALEKAAAKIAKMRVTDPWFFWKPNYSVDSTTETREGVNVEVKKDGSFKKGSKQVLAAALYEKHKALSNAEIIAIFMKELDMSKAGSMTYLYNCKKAAK